MLAEISHCEDASWADTSCEVRTPLWGHWLCCAYQWWEPLAAFVALPWQIERRQSAVLTVISKTLKYKKPWSHFNTSVTQFGWSDINQIYLNVNQLGLVRVKRTSKLKPIRIEFGFILSTRKPNRTSSEPNQTDQFDLIRFDFRFYLNHVAPLNLSLQFDEIS